jgi:hypothetical protein
MELLEYIQKNILGHGARICFSYGWNINAPVGILLGICDIAYTNLVTEVWWVKGLRQRYDFSQSLAENHETINAYSQSVRTEEYLINKDGPVNYYYFTSID